ncbi:MAG: T9SS type A sorting domain-containing protein, partial [Candidatus Kariarchaeaceae archaeon]
MKQNRNNLLGAIILILCLGIFPFLYGQDEISWIRVVDCEGWLHSPAIRLTEDDGFLISGFEYPVDKDSIVKPLIIKIDQNGDSIWTKSNTLYANDIKYTIHMQPTDDGGYILGGSTNTHYPDTGEIILYKLDYKLDTLWSSKNHNIGILISDIQQTNDGGNIICGGLCPCTRFDHSKLIKTDKNGEVIWTRVDTTIGRYVYAQQMADEGYIIVASGMHPDLATPDDDIDGLIKTNSLGDTLWTHRFDNCELGDPSPIIQTADNEFVVILSPCFGLEYDDRAPEFGIQKFDNNGNLLWSKAYESKESLIIYNGKGEQTDDDGLIIFVNQRLASEKAAVWLLKTDEYGDTIWTSTFGGIENNYGVDVKQTSDGGFILLVERYIDDDLQDILLIKTDANGNVISSLDQIKSANNLRIYPNPAITCITVETCISDLYNIEITSLNGQLLYNDRMEGPTHQIDLSSFEKGLYIITIRSRD